jgi:methylglyoxal reductase
MNCLIKLKDEGKIRAIGVSNINILQLKEYQSVGVVDTIQPRYSMLDRKIEEELIPYCHNKNVSSLVYSPLEQGLLTGKINMQTTFTETEYRNQIPWFIPDKRQMVLDMLAGWEDLTNKYSCNLAQLVIAGLLCSLVLHLHYAELVNLNIALKMQPQVILTLNCVIYRRCVVMLKS